MNGPAGRAARYVLIAPAVGRPFDAVFGAVH